jgi:acyl carrier protein
MGGRMDKLTIETMIKEIVALQFGYRLEDITTNMRFVEDLKADSLDALEIIMGVEDKFNISIQSEDADGLMTVQMVIDFVERILANKSN